MFTDCRSQTSHAALYEHVGWRGFIGELVNDFSRHDRVSLHHELGYIFVSFPGGIRNYDPASLPSFLGALPHGLIVASTNLLDVGSITLDRLSAANATLPGNEDNTAAPKQLCSPSYGATMIPFSRGSHR